MMKIKDWPFCQEHGTVTENVTECDFLYGDSIEEHPVTLKATYPLMTCSKCKGQYFDYRGEKAREKVASEYELSLIS